jgi:cysteine desulfurase
VIYLDYQATTPLAPEARAAMLPWLDAEGSANPHSSHVAGRKAKAAVDVAREQVAALLPSGGRVFFTSGATEAINWALRCCRATRFAAPATEHAAVLDTFEAMRCRGKEVSILPVGRDGLVDASQLPNRLDLFAAMLVNNEIGTIQPVAALAESAKARGALVLCDSVQGYGRVAIPEDADLIAISAHKIHGPKGIGALWVRDGVALEPLLHGGGQEGGLRSGTLSHALCAGFGAAAALAKARMAEDAAHAERLWHVAIARLGDWTINGSTEQRWRGNLNIRRVGIDSARLISDLRDIAFSSGSACASGSGRPSHVLRALGLTDAEARSSIRLGFGRYTTEAELTEALDRIAAAADAQLRMAA